MVKPYLIGIAGPSCSGKSYLARHVAERLQAPIFSFDAYYRDRSRLSEEEVEGVNFDEPAALDNDLLLQHLAALSRGQAVQRPVYDYKTHCRLTRLEPIQPARYVVVEGLFALYWEEVRALLGTKVFIQVADELCLDRRQTRDVADRGRSAEQVLKQFEESVRPMSELYIQPTVQFADVVIRGEDEVGSKVAAVLRHVRRRNSRPARADQHE